MCSGAQLGGPSERRIRNSCDYTSDIVPGDFGLVARHGALARQAKAGTTALGESLAKWLGGN